MNSLDLLVHLHLAYIEPKQNRSAEFEEAVDPIDLQMDPPLPARPRSLDFSRFATLAS